MLINQAGVTVFVLQLVPQLFLSVPEPFLHNPYKTKHDFRVKRVSSAARPGQRLGRAFVLLEKVSRNDPVVLQDLVHRGPFFRVNSHDPVDQPASSLRDVRRDRELSVLDLLVQLLISLGLERVAPAEQDVQQHAQGPDVRRGS